MRNVSCLIHMALHNLILKKQQMRSGFLETLKIKSKLYLSFLLGGCVMSVCPQPPAGGPWKDSPTSPLMLM